jgi:hypothetical protein
MSSSDEFQRNARGEIKPSFLNTVIALQKLHFSSSKPLDRMQNINLRYDIGTTFGFEPGRQTLADAVSAMRFAQDIATAYSSAGNMEDTNGPTRPIQ